MAIPILGDLWSKIVDKGGSIISELVTDKDLAKRLDHEFRSQMDQNSALFKQAELEAETRIFEAQQKTIQVELHQNDQYTKRTRPSIARKSFYAGLAYALRKHQRLADPPLHETGQLPDRVALHLARRDTANANLLARQCIRHGFGQPENTGL